MLAVSASFLSVLSCRILFKKGVKYEWEHYIKPILPITFSVCIVGFLIEILIVLLILLL